MKKILILALIFSSHLARAELLLCKVKLRTENYSEKKISTASGESTQFEDVEGYRLKLNNLGGSKFEIEVFDGNAETRSYARATLKNSANELSWSLWSRENLIESSCKLN